VTVVVIAVIAVGAGVGVAAWSGSRKPGQNVTGRTVSTSSSKLAEAAQLAGEGKLQEAIAAYQAVLDENPDDVEALTYFGWLLRNVGVSQDDDELHDSGVRLIERATQLEPTYSEAWFFRGIIFLRDEEQPQKAVDALKLALANDPIPEIQSAARELLAEIAQQQ
jgi:tetratricopeptide (TPR) repeat protein